ncbi:stage II sporulation protein P [Bacillus massilinigeriensis]|uniref:stage II sporulation protein P n=1 Tax=Bacillus mediterraneensis TaxID=1805474 RepID=UPI0008F8C778|nr:stage II sporulation protein P [Bacillus mediterraneensis]
MKLIKSNGLILTIHGTSLVKVMLGFLIFLVAVFSLSGLLTSVKPDYRPASSSVNHAADKIDGKTLFRMFGMENHQFLNVLPDEASLINLGNVLFRLSTNISLEDPRSLLGRELPGFSIFDGRILVAGEGTNYTNMPMESAPPPEVLKAEKEAALQNTDDIEKGNDSGDAPAPSATTGDKKVVYLYFTHNRESYLPYLKGVTDPDKAYHTKVNVTRVGDRLKSSLESNGIGTTVDKTDILNAGFNSAYQESRSVVASAMNRDKNLTYFIDIHRDGYRKDKTTIDINGQPYAKLAFVIGGENANYEKNLQLATELHHRLEGKYKGISRGIIEKRGAGTNGKFNQDLSENALLIEFGGVDNTFEELDRSADALADVFSEMYWQAEKVNAP